MFSHRIKAIFSVLALSAAFLTSAETFVWDFNTPDSLPAGTKYIGARRGKYTEGAGGKGLRVGVEKGGKNIQSASLALSPIRSSAAGTVTFRVKPEWNGTDKDFRNFVQLSGKGGEFFEIYRLHNSKGVFIVTLMGKNGKRADAGYDMQHWKKGTWYHIAVSWDDKFITIWENGKLKRRTAVKGFKFSSDFDALHVGRYIKTYNGGYMIMDDVKVYDKVLTDKEVKADFRNAAPRAGADPLQVSAAAGTFTYTIPGSSKTITSKGLPLFSFRLYDEQAKKDNNKPLNGKGHFWGTSLAMTGKEITSRECKLVSAEKPAPGETVLTYKHPAATVKFFLKSLPGKLEQYAVITNTGKYPIYEFTSLNFTLPRQTGENVIVPFPPRTGIEFSKFVDWKWAMNYAWDGFIVREKSGRLLAVDRYQDIEKLYLPGWGVLNGNEKNWDLQFAGQTVIFAKPGESRTSIRTVIRQFKDVREWADNYIVLNYPRGLKKLSEKLTQAQFEKFSRAYLAPTWVPIKAASSMVDRAPGTFIVHPPVYMHPCKGFRSNWDAFPNYFPPAKRIGTMDEFADLIKKIVDSGNIFMPRTSFYYWVEGSDFALTHDLKKNAIVRIDGKPRTAMWAQPGYMMSPSAKEVLDYLDKIYDRWASLGINAYFTNVIGAQLPDHNSFDFHPDAPAPDMFYTQLFKLHKKYGQKQPLFSEDGGLFSMPYQVAICCNAVWLAPVPGNLAHRGTLVRSAPEFSLSLLHEYIRFYTSNTGFMKAASSPRALSYSLTHGTGLKAAFVNEFELNPEKRRWIRTTALFAGEIHNENYGKRLNSFVEKNGITTALYGSNLIIGNYSGKPYAAKADKYDAVIAPDGFLFVSGDKNKIAGYFSEFAGNKFETPVLLVYLKKGCSAELYAPVALNETKLKLHGVAITIPSYPAVIAKKIPGVRVDFAAKKFVADPVIPDKARLPKIGQDKVIPLPAAAGKTVLQWKAGEKLPAPLKGLNASLTPAGLRITSPVNFSLEGLSGKIAVEMGFVFNVYPEEKSRDPIPFLSAGKNFKLDLSTYTGRLFLAGSTPGKAASWGVSIDTKKYNMISAVLNGKEAVLTFNKNIFKAPSKALFPAGKSTWTLGFDKCDFTITSIRFSSITQ